jgi:hypothetical protein
LTTVCCLFDVFCPDRFTPISHVHVPACCLHFHMLLCLCRLVVPPLWWASSAAAIQHRSIGWGTLLGAQQLARPASVCENPETQADHTDSERSHTQPAGGPGGQVCGPYGSVRVQGPH